MPINWGVYYYKNMIWYLTLFAESSDAWRLTDFSFRVRADPKEDCDNTVETGDLGVCEKEEKSGGDELFGLRKDDGAVVAGVIEAAEVCDGLDGNIGEATVLGTEEEGTEETKVLGVLRVGCWDLNKGDTDFEGRRRIGVLKAEVELGFFVVDEISGLEVEDDGEEETTSGDGLEDKVGGNNSNSVSEIAASDPESDDSTGAAINGGSVERSSINLTDGIFVDDEE